MSAENSHLAERGIFSMPDEDWNRARQRAKVIFALVAAGPVTAQAADLAGATLGNSRRQVYELARRHRQGAGLVTDLAPGDSDGGRGSGRLPEAVEAIIRKAIKSEYLDRQRLSLAVVHRDIAQICRSRDLPVPSHNSVARRILLLHQAQVKQSREGVDGARSLRAAGDAPPVVQIDHTVIDLMVVDERDRPVIGRPYLTAAIDVYSRCLVGMVIALEAPSAVLVGLCLAQVCCDKRPWIEGLDSAVDWPMSGKPQRLYMDNAAEFKSEALRRGCAQHSIELNYRLLGRPHYGGIVERDIGTLMVKVHELPGTTFSNPAQRGSYPSEKRASLTLRELERWIPEDRSHVPPAD